MHASFDLEIKHIIEPDRELQKIMQEALKVLSETPSPNTTGLYIISTSGLDFTYTPLRAGYLILHKYR